jgi:hypothetical protein
MQVDFSVKILDFEGKPLKQDGSGSDLTLKGAAQIALMAQYRDEQELPATEKVRRFKLAMAIENGAMVDLPVEDIAEIKRLIGKGMNALIVGRVFELLA